MKSRKALYALICIICVAAISDMPGVLDLSYGESITGASNCSSVDSKTTFESSESCPTEFGCEGSHVPGYVSNKASGDTMDIIIKYNKCSGTATCLYNKFKDFYSTDACIETTYY